jgi:hypothetical protein
MENPFCYFAFFPLFSLHCFSLYQTGRSEVKRRIQGIGLCFDEEQATNGVNNSLISVRTLKPIFLDFLYSYNMIPAFSLLLTLQKSRARLVDPVSAGKSEASPRVKSRGEMPSAFPTCCVVAESKAYRINNTVILKVLLEYTNGDVLE